MVGRSQEEWHTISRVGRGAFRADGLLFPQSNVLEEFLKGSVFRAEGWPVLFLGRPLQDPRY